MKRSVDIKFSKDGGSYYLTFCDGTQSPVYYSKQAGLNDPNLICGYKSGLISEVDFQSVNTLIIEATIRYFELESKEPYGPVKSAFFDKDQSVIRCKNGTCAVVPDLNDLKDIRSTLDVLVFTGDINPRECEDLKKEFDIL